jgi:NADH dehydrogenase
MKISVTGAYSFTGKYISQRLLLRGDEVVTLTNHPNRPDPFAGKVKAFPLDFDDEKGLRRSMAGCEVLVNTYWVRFDRGSNTQKSAVENTRRLVRAAQSAGIGRIVHISIANPSAASPLPYYRGKAANEENLIQSGLAYTILRPSLLFGSEDILINNIAWLLRHFPFFAQIGDGQYRVQPVYVEDLAGIAAEACHLQQNQILDVAGADIYTFDQLVRLIGQSIGRPRPILHAPPLLALAASRGLGLLLGDILLTKQELDGLREGLLVSSEPPLGRTRFADWLNQHHQVVGASYASEINRHYHPPKT